MNKSDMTTEQLKERDLFVELLTANGWKHTEVNKLFEQDTWLSTEAELFFDKNLEGGLRAELILEEKRVILSIYEHLVGSLRLGINYNNKLKNLLDIVINFQNDIDIKQPRQQVKKILEVFPEIYVLRDDEDKKLTIDML
jgi:hypothetical protein